MQRLGGLKGGAERIVVETACNLKRRNIDVEIVTYDPSSLPVAYDLQGVPVHNLLRASTPQTVQSAPRPGLGMALAFLKSWPLVWPLTHLRWHLTHGRFESRLKAYLKANNADVLVGFLPPAISASSRVGKALKIPVVASTHNVPERDFGLSSDRWDQNPVFKKKAQAALLEADVITVLLDEFHAWYPDRVHNRLVTLPNPVSRLSPAATPPPERKNIILGVGRLTKIKQYDHLISAWSKLHKTHPNWRVDIYGEGPEYENLQRQIIDLGLETSVRLHGRVNDIAERYDTAQILCHPAEFEGFGLSVAEAMAHGLAVVAYADCQGINTLVQNRENGLLISSDTARIDGLADGIDQLISNQSLRQDLAQQATEIVTRYAKDTIYDLWEDTLIRPNKVSD